MKALILKAWRIFRWWFRCLWEGKVIPRKESRLFSRSYMRKAWIDRLRDIDRRVNDGPDYMKEVLLRERRIMVIKRNLYRFE
jgi:hypothetical protein